MKSREYEFDNAKGFLMICVVLGHMLEGNLVGISRILYILIYSFHIPFLVFISGYFAKFDILKILSKLLVPYIILQLAACFLKSIIVGYQISFITPIWTLWYLQALIVWKMLLPLITTNNVKLRITIFIGSIAISLVAGLNTSIGYKMGLSRIIVFFPYFILGYYIRDVRTIAPKLHIIYKCFSKRICFTALIIIFSVICLVEKRVDYRYLYGTYSYKALSYSPLERIVMYIIGIVEIITLLKLMSQHKTILSTIGKKSMRIYIGHPLFVIILRRYFNSWQEAIACTVCIVFILSFEYSKLPMYIKKFVRIFLFKMNTIEFIISVIINRINLKINVLSKKVGPEWKNKRY
jgi:fucose 4-O-acetylase-like acetyltransferase